MEYMQAVNKLREIEDKYDVMSIKMKGISIWPYLRVYVFDAMATHKAQGVSKDATKQMLGDLFFYNPLRLFKRYDVWNVSSRITRKKIGKYYEHHVSGALHQMGWRVLTFESPAKGMHEIRRVEIPERNIVSGAWLTLLYGLFFLLMKLFSVKIDGKEELKRIIEENNIKLDYLTRVKMLYAQKLTSDFLFSIIHKPRLLMMECSYTQMGRVWSAHNHEIPVVELQHGVINASHYAYSPKYHSAILYPDEICVYGEEEYKYFHTLGKEFTPNVNITGLYMLEQCEKELVDDIFSEQRRFYKTIAVIAGQTGFETQLSEFIDGVADEMPEVYFVYIPRRYDPAIRFSCTNVEYVFGVNIYEYLRWCDVHITISSTTALEAHYFGKPVVFCDFSGVAKIYYGEILEEKNGVRYIKDEEHFKRAMAELSNDVRFEQKEVFAHNHRQLLKNVLDKYLKK